MSKQKNVNGNKIRIVNHLQRGKNKICVLFSIVLNSVFYYRKKTESKDSTQVYIQDDFLSKTIYLSWSHLSK